MNELLRVKDVAKILRVSPHSIRKYCNEGKLGFELTPGGQRVFTQAHVDAYLGIESRLSVIGYVRSFSGDKQALKEQERLIRESYPDCVVYHDKGSGLNENRPGLWRAIKMIENNEANTLVVAHKDRLSRFGVRFIEHHVNHVGGQIIYLRDSEPESLESELMRDFMMLIASFSGRFYRLRGKTQQNKLLDKARSVLNES